MVTANYRELGRWVWGLSESKGGGGQRSAEIGLYLLSNKE